MSSHHELYPTPENIHWGYHDAALAPVLRVASGDTVHLTSWAAADASALPPDRSLVQPGHLEALEQCAPGPATHMLTGPVHVEGAEPGDVLQIDLLDIALNERWGYTAIRPLRGTLPDEFDRPAIIHPEIDIQSRTARLPWGTEIALAPFFGIIAVAPPPHWGRVPSIQPRKFGGNMDNKELIAGTTLYLPVFTPGALFSAGDGHAVQGDGEVCLTALETCMTGTFELIVRKDLALAMPRAETPGHYLTMGMNEDLDDAAKQALREMIALIRERTNLSAEDAYTLCSLMADLRITQLVDGNKGVHALLPKTALG